MTPNDSSERHFDSSCLMFTLVRWRIMRLIYSESDVVLCLIPDKIRKNAFISISRIHADKIQREKFEKEKKKKTTCKHDLQTKVSISVSKTFNYKAAADFLISPHLLLSRLVHVVPSYLISSYLVPFCLILSHHVSSHLVSSQSISSCPVSFHHILSCLILFVTSCLILSSHFISSHPSCLVPPRLVSYFTVL